MDFDQVAVNGVNSNLLFTPFTVTHIHLIYENIAKRSRKILPLSKSIFFITEDVYEVLLRPVRLSKPVQHQKLSCSLSVLPGSCGMLLLHMLRLQKK